MEQPFTVGLQSSDSSGSDILFGITRVYKSAHSYYRASPGPLQGTVGVFGASYDPFNCQTFNSF